MRTIPILFLALLIETAAAQVPTIRGQIFVPNPSFNERIEVRLEKPGGELLGITFSDPTGVFLFYDTPTGVDGLFVVVKLDGYEPVKEAIQFGRTGSTNIKINLTPKSDASTAAAADANIVDLDDLKQRYPRRVLEDYERAQEESRRGEVSKAAERLETVLKQAPQFYQARNALGSAYQKLGRFQDAEKAYNLVRQQNPRFSLALVNLGTLYIQLERLEQAHRYLKEAVTLNERSAPAHSLLGSVYYKTGSYNDAEASLKRALEIEPRMGQARLTLVNLYTRQQKWHAALQHIDAFLAENPTAPERTSLLNIRAKVLLLVGPRQ